MTTEPKNPALLPNGFVDILPPVAEQEANAVAKLLEVFSQFGYQRVKPPLVEFEDSLFAPGPGAALVHESFRLMDPVSHKMMGVRSDITAQIARIAETRLAEEPRPLRLTYANDVLRTRANQQRTERQFCQVGCEIIGEDCPAMDVEAALVSLVGLRNLDISNITLDIAVPRLVSDLLDDHALSFAEREKIQTHLERRDRDGFNDVDPDLSKTLTGLLEATGEGQKALQQLQALKLPKVIQGHIDRLQKFHEDLRQAIEDFGLQDIQSTIDPVEHKGFEYHTGVAFTLFADDVFGELGRGGRYHVYFNEDQSESAAGFTLYMDTLRRVMPAPEARDVLLVPFEENWATVRKFQQEGWIVVKGTQEEQNQARCTHVCKNGKIEKIY